MKDFVFKFLTKVNFGIGAAKRVGEECKALGATKVFFVTDKFMQEHSPAYPMIMDSFKSAGLEVLVFSDVEPDPSVETVDKGAQMMKDFGAEVAVALGGGSPMDCAKTMSMLQTNEGSIREYIHKRRAITKPAKPLICIPTTAGTGSEVTAAAVTTDKQSQEKLGLADDSLMPRMALIDPELHVGMPPGLTASTGLDALCHAIEAYVAVASEPFTDALAIYAIKMIGANIGKAVANGRDIEARSNMAIASTVAGGAFSNASLGLVHGIAHCLGAMYHVPHGTANALMLPYVMEFNAMAAPEKFREIAIALGADVSGMNLRDAALEASKIVSQMCADCGVPLTLKEVGVKKEDIPTIVKNTITYARLPNNPRTVSEKDIEKILLTALEK